LSIYLRKDRYKSKEEQTRLESGVHCTFHHQVLIVIYRGYWGASV